MEGAWWTDQSDLDEEQLRFVDCPPDGKYLLVGPPGSGKTNLLLLRAKYFYGAGLKNILFLTFTNDLCSFIRTGIGSKGYLPEDLVSTYHSWAAKHVRDILGPKEIADLGGYTDESRDKLLELTIKASNKSVTKKLYDMILVDEAQDLSLQELQLLISLSDRVAIAGDIRQGIYEKDGLINPSKLPLEIVQLTYHYRIGHAVCKVADKIIPPANEDLLLEKFCNYKESDFESSAELQEFTDREEQFNEMYKNIQTQLKAYPGASIGILASTNNTIMELRERFSSTPLATDIAYHDLNDIENSFSSGKRIHVLTAHSAKGTEFRAVHIFGIEEFKYPRHKRELIYTAVTRAKTSLNGYKTGKVLAYIESAFAKQTPTDLKDIF